ncbi:MAG TPA: methionyl-tRNA formyltransferase [Candidatus Hydrogenedentes bacterium]|nr:methionyl-tRNA formyltransferase [Candidatus Hydrogenedentota bacterium]
MRIVYFGTPELAVPTLAAAAGRHEVAALVCQPDKPKGRSKKVVPAPTKVWAEEHGIAVVQPTKLNDGTFEVWLKEQAPDVCVVAAYGRMLKQPILDVPEHGFLNMHPSLLPRHRGPAPIQTAILEGDVVTGVTVMRLDARMDTGDIVLQVELPIHPEDTTETLSRRLAVLGASVLTRALELVETGEAVFTPQDHDKATTTRLLAKEDGRIRWAAPARAIHNLIRAAVPWPMAQCGWKGQVCRIHKSAVIEEDTNAEPGTVVHVESDRVLVATGDGLLAMRVFQAPGGRAMPMADYLRGHPITPGDKFEDL